MSNDRELVALSQSKWRLATLWFVGFIILFIIMLGQTIGGLYINEGEIKTAWNWFLPNIAPTLTLIIGVLVGEAQEKDKPKRMVDRKFYRLSVVVSSFYLLVIMSHIVIPPFFAPSRMMDLIGMSGIWLGVVQGFVAAVLGVFFVRQEVTEK